MATADDPFRATPAAAIIDVDAQVTRDCAGTPGGEVYRVPAAALPLGFRNEPVGALTSRTIMLAELRLLLAAVPPDADPAAYRAAAVEDNALGKATPTTRRATLQHLRELYALSPDVPLFAALRDLWTADAAAQPLLALLCRSRRSSPPGAALNSSGKPGDGACFVAAFASAGARSASSRCRAVSARPSGPIPAWISLPGSRPAAIATGPSAKRNVSIRPCWPYASVLAKYGANWP